MKKFEDWKEHCRGEFKDDPDSMNLINLCLKGLDKSEPESEDAKNFNARLKEFYDNDLSRSGKLKCEHCGNEMKVYYTSKCFHCETCKPGVGEDGSYNLIESMYYVENNEEDFDYDTFWSELCDNETIYGNDKPCKLYDFKSDNMTLFKKHYPVDKIYYVSW